ncbi:MAG: hypothetical protein ACK4QW_04415 [Alphaproteobacteria bacterium]
MATAGTGRADDAGGGAVPLPSLEAMGDTLQFVWAYYVAEFATARAADPRATVDVEHGGARVRMRIEAFAERGRAAGETDRTVYLALLSVAGGDPPFRLEGVCDLDPPDPADQRRVDWQAFGNHESLVAWMIPWVWRHVEEGGGWIEFP